MGVKIHEENNLERVEKEFRKLIGKRIKVGVAAARGSKLDAYASANEFGAEIKPKSGKYLAVPIHPEAKGLSPRKFNDLVFLKGKSGGGILALKSSGRELIPMYALLKKVIIPERSYLRSAMADKATKANCSRITGDAIKAVFAGASAEAITTALGSSLAASVKKKISSNIGPRNSSLTLLTKSAKGITLVDEAQLIKATSWEVI